MATTAPTSHFDSSAATSQLLYRSILPKDRLRIQQLHEEFFPVRYSPQFYQDVVEEKGIFGGKLFSVIVENEREEVIGFVLAQMLSYPSQCDDNDLFDSNSDVKEVFYILTIGLVPGYRKLGIASQLIRRCIDYANQFPSCGAVYLHVIDYNTAAMGLYQKNNFQYLKKNPDFYHINGQYHTAHVYLFPLHQHRLPSQRGFLDQISSVTEMALDLLSSAMAAVFSDGLLAFFRAVPFTRASSSVPGLLLLPGQRPPSPSPPGQSGDDLL